MLAQSIVNVGLKNVTSGANPMDLKRGIDKAVASVVESIAKQAKTVGDNYDKIEQVATVSPITIPHRKTHCRCMRKCQRWSITIEEAKELKLLLMWWKECSLTAAIFRPILLLQYRTHGSGV